MPDSVFTRTLALPDGGRVRLRLARPADAPEVERLLGATPLDVRRLLRFDPARRAVVCALNGREQLVGVGAIDLFDDAEPDVVAAELPGVEALLTDVLRRRAQSHGRRVA
jgi:hypothetical protein